MTVHTTTSATGRRRYAARLPASERRQQILGAALVVVGEHGYRGLTMEAVAREAGVTKPVVYDAFANRDEVMIALLAEEEQRAVAEILQAIGAVPDDLAAVDIVELLLGSVRRVLETVRLRPQAYRLILLQIQGTPAVVRARIDAGRRTVADRVQQLLIRAIRPADGVDTELLALSIVALGEHAAALVLSDPERFPPERFEAGLRQALGALLPPQE
ncbi:MAG: hypothetical protein JWO02_3270 [Solirubrobacterales bacterium]|nr:hypothetical protein [Solirubrobacterales bacterium]